jgi:1-acyl-sn-glycerol-3-phosphate acyltransferase
MGPPREEAAGSGTVGAHRRDERSVLWRVAEALVAPAFRLAFDLRFAGLECIPGPGRPAILAANHVSVLDPIAIALAAVRRRRTIRFLAAVEFFRHPVWGPPLRLMGQVPVRRGARDVGALDEVVAHVRRGGLAGIFPEGRVADGRLPLRGRTGAARVALATGAPVVPVGVWGTQARWPRAGLRWRPPRRVPVAVAVGEPIVAGGPPVGSAVAQDGTVPVPGVATGGGATAGPPATAGPGSEPERDEVQALTRRIMAAIEVQVARARRMVGEGDVEGPAAGGR